MLFISVCFISLLRVDLLALKGYPFKPDQVNGLLVSSSPIPSPILQ